MKKLNVDSLIIEKNISYENALEYSENIKLAFGELLFEQYWMGISTGIMIALGEITGSFETEYKMKYEEYYNKCLSFFKKTFYILKEEN